MKALVVVPLCLLAAALLGGIAGYQFGRSPSSAGADPMIDLFTAAQSRYSSYLFAIRRDRNNEAHEDDLRSYLAYLDARAGDRGAANPNIYAFDKALARIRLSQLAQLRGATAVSIRLTEEADAICPATGLRNCSANNVLFTARERDRRVWGVPGNTTAE
jgi:hypothetical protein